MSTVDEFLNGIGINVHMTYWDTPYGDVQRVKAELGYLGVRLLRDGAPAPDYDGLIASLAGEGYRFDFIAGYTRSPAQNVAAIADFARRFPGSVAAVEGPNEVDHWPVPDTQGDPAASAAAYQRALYAGVRADATLAATPVYNLTVGSSTSSLPGQIGNLAAYADAANIHVYHSYGTAPSHAFADYLAAGQRLATGDPTVITEAGYQTRTSAATGVDERIQAIYTLETLFVSAGAGVSRTFLYELTDQFPAASGTEQFGLFAYDGQPKLAATALHNLTSILQGSAGSASGPASPAVTGLSAQGGAASSLELTGSDGARYLMVWRSEARWDAASGRAAAVSPLRLDLRLGAGGTVAVYDPVGGSAAVAAYADVTSLSYTLSDQPLVFRIAAAGTAPGISAGPSMGDDVLQGTTGNDIIRLLAGNDVYTALDGADTVFGNQGSDTLYGNQGADVLYGGQDADRLYGGQGADLLFGNLGADLVLGNLGADTLFGGQGADTLYGGQGDDVLSGDLGDDVLSGDLGADTYVFGRNSGADLILGFSQAQGDRLDLQGQSFTLGTAANGNALLTLSGGGTVELAGIPAAQVNGGVFV